MLCEVKESYGNICLIQETIAKRDRKGFLAHPSDPTRHAGPHRAVTKNVEPESDKSPNKVTMKISDSIIAPINSYVNRSVQTERLKKGVKALLFIAF